MTNSIPYYLPIPSSGFATGGQPSPEQLQALHDAGFSGILNISPANTRNYLSDEGAIAARLGLQYTHVPIDCSALVPEQYEAFAQALDLLKPNESSKVFIHCGMNIKASGFMHLYRIKRLGHAKADSLEDLKKTPGHEPKWSKYWEQMGV